MKATGETQKAQASRRALNWGGLQLLTVTFQRADGTKREVQTSQALLLFQDGDEIGIMGECSGLFIRIIESADMIRKAAKKQKNGIKVGSLGKGGARIV